MSNTSNHSSPSRLNDRTGWPWAGGKVLSPATAGGGWPRISVVTPSFNQGQYLEQTILSVLSQCYPNLEYIVIDGGSTDNSVEIIKKYAAHIAYWESEPDRGQVHAIHKGVERATGDILCWLNSDDWYLPGALFGVASQFRQREIDFLYGGCLLRYEKSPDYYFVRMPQTLHSVTTDLAVLDYVDQPSSFWSRRAWETVGPLDESLNYAFDWDFFIRMSRVYPLWCSEGVYSAYRHHDAHKSGAGGDPRMREIVEVVRRHSTDDWVQAYEECRVRLLPASRQFLERWTWLTRVRVGGWRLFQAKKRQILGPALRRHGEHKIRVASIMTGVCWDPGMF